MCIYFHLRNSMWIIIVQTMYTRMYCFFFVTLKHNNSLSTIQYKELRRNTVEPAYDREVHCHNWRNFLFIKKIGSHRGYTAKNVQVHFLQISYRNFDFNFLRKTGTTYYCLVINLLGKKSFINGNEKLINA